MSHTSDEYLRDKVIEFESKVESLEMMKSAIYDAIQNLDSEDSINNE